MSINVGVTAANPVTLTPATAAMTLAPATHQITATSNNAVTVSAGLESLALAKFNTQINTNVIVQPPLESLALNALLPAVDFTPIQGDVNVDCNNESLVLTEQNPSISTSDLKTWSYRANQPGVIQAINFSTAQHIQAINDNRFKTAASVPAPGFDAYAGEEETIKVSGGYSLRQTYPDKATEVGHADWGFDFGETLGDGGRSPGTNVPTSLNDPPQQFGLQTGAAEDLGNEMYIQWRQYWPLASLNILWKVDAGRGGWKFIKVINSDYFKSGAGTFMPSDNAKELTGSNIKLCNAPGFQTGRSATTFIGSTRNTAGQNWIEGPTDPNPGMEHEGLGSDDIWQNAFILSGDLEDVFSQGSTFTKQGTGTCIQGFGCNLDWLRTDFTPMPGNQITWSGAKKHPFRGQDDTVFEFYPDEWLTFKIHVTLGTRSGGYWRDSTFRLYGQRDGGNAIQIIDDTLDLEYNEGSEPAPPDDQEGYGKLFFTPYHTGCVSQESPSRGTYNTYIDEIIVSQNDIADSVSAAAEQAASGETTLEQRIAGLAVGEWENYGYTFPTNFFEDPNSGESAKNTTLFSHNIHWDKTRKFLYWAGADYGDGVWYRFDAQNDVWERGTMPVYPPDGQFRHSWDGTAFDESRNEFYVSGQLFGQNKYRVKGDELENGVGAWTLLPNIPSSSADTYGTCFWPSKDSLAHYVPGREFRLFNRGTGIWTEPYDLGGTQAYHSWAAHDPVRDVMYCGGGNDDKFGFYEWDGTSTPQRLTDCPQRMDALGNGPRGKTDVDRNTGDVVTYETTTGTMRKYTDAGGWSGALSTTGKPILNPNTLVGNVNIPGVASGFVYINATSKNAGTMWIYRHS